MSVLGDAAARQPETDRLIALPPCGRKIGEMHVVMRLVLGFCASLARFLDVALPVR